MTPEEIVEKLRPIQPDKIDRIWQAYLYEDTAGKREIEQYLQILFNQQFPDPNQLSQVNVLIPPPADKVRGEYPIGEITYANKILHPFGLREKDWIKHVLIIGASGTGKTNLCFQVLKNFLYQNKPFLVFDWKRNYRDIIHEPYAKDVEVYTVARNIAPFRFNPLIPPPGTCPKSWLKKLIEIIAHATFVGEGVMYLLQKGLDQTYSEFGLYKDEPVEKNPTLENLLTVMEKMEAKGREAGWMASTLRSLGALTFGESGKVFNITAQTNLSELLTKPVILELDALTNSDKTFLIESLLLWIHHYRLSSPSGKREEFEHAIILEEAHHIIGKAKSDLIGGEAITDVIIREIRELGESVIIIDQCPSLLSLPARANTWATIALNLKDAKDVNSASSALLLESDEKKQLGRLDVGEAIAKIQGRWHRAFKIKIPFVPIQKGSISDEKLSSYSSAYSIKSIPEPPESVEQKEIPPIPESRQIEEDVKPEELELLQDIKSNPFSGVVERYKRLGWSRRKGNTKKIALISKGFVGVEEIPTESGRIVVLKLRKIGEEYLSRIDVKSENDGERKGGIIHEYWKEYYAKLYKEKGYIVTKEYPIGNGQSVDLVAQNDNKKIAIEIETGRSDILRNIEKCIAEDFQKIMVIATNDQAELKIYQIINDHDLSQESRIEIENVNKGKLK